MYYTYYIYVRMYLNFMFIKYFKDNNLVYPRKKNYPVLPTTQLVLKQNKEIVE